MMRRKGFTLLELMVVLTIIIIIATASVPQIQLWIARNRGLTAVSMILSDFSKAKAIAEYSMNVNRTSLDNGEFQRQKNRVAIMFRATSYSILQQTGDGNWDTVTPLKRSKVPLNVFIEDVNTNPPTDNPGPSPATFVFSSTGRLKDSAGALVSPGAGLTGLQCGPVPSPIDTTRIFVATLKSQIDSSNALWYRIEIDTDGEYFVCMERGSSTAPKTDFVEDTANVLDL